MRGACLLVALSATTISAHDGPPFPILADHQVGRYSVSIWTDPDATDDGSAGGQFWVVVDGRDGAEVPAGTRAQVAVTALDRPGAETLTATAEPVRGDVGNQFAAVVMDHEGPYRVTVSLSGPLGEATVTSQADATYDLRPPPYMLAWYLAPFVAVGLLWGRLLMLRRRKAA